MEGNKFIKISGFEEQNNGYGQIIQYEDEYYYVFLQLNYNLKIYDGIRLYKIGANTETENILIQYIPEEYIWKNIYTAESNSNAQLDRYLEAIKQEITSKQYLEVGAGEDIKVFYGDEVGGNHHFAR